MPRRTSPSGDSKRVMTHERAVPEDRRSHYPCCEGREGEGLEEEREGEEWMRVWEKGKGEERMGGLLLGE